MMDAWGSHTVQDLSQGMKLPTVSGSFHLNAST